MVLNVHKEGGAGRRCRRLLRKWDEGGYAHGKISLQLIQQLGLSTVKPRDDKRMVLRKDKENRGQWQQRGGYCGCSVDG